MPVEYPKKEIWLVPNSPRRGLVFNDSIDKVQRVPFSDKPILEIIEETLILAHHTWSYTPLVFEISLNEKGEEIADLII